MHVVIMAGGSGTRFWPLSRRSRPKQMLALWGDETLMQVTVRRLEALTSIDRILIVTGQHLAEPIADLLPDLPRENILVEPCARNTLPCIGLAAAVIKQRDPDGVMAIFPADHYIEGSAFERACVRACEGAREGRIVTLGVRPTRPETGYGYIRYTPGAADLLGVDAFVEKPDLETAKSYLSEGTYLWNAGIFFVSVPTFDGEVARQQPQMHAGFSAMARAIAADDWDAADAAFAQLPSVSVDYGIMEGADNVAVIPAAFRWNDVGHWAALDEVLDVDPAGNVVHGDVCAIETSDAVLYNETGGKRLLAVVGLDDIVVVETDDATLVLPKSQAQRVREVVAWLKAKKRNELL